MLPPMQGIRMSFQNEDNVVTNEVTVVIGNPVVTDGENGEGGADHVVPPVTGSASSRPPVLTLEQIKAHIRIEPDQTDDDAYLQLQEMAARLHTENVLRRTFDDMVGEHVKMAMLLLIAHWYRNREAVTDEYKMVQLPLAYEALLSVERAYPAGVY
jgi:hypothetical protein